MDVLDKYTKLGIDLAVEYTPTLIAAISTLVIGLWVIKLITKGLNKALTKKNIDPSLQGFASSLVNITLKVLLVVSAAGMLGFEMTSFIAILGAAGLAIGMALSGTLQNFAGGVMILVFRPYKVGDFIEAQGYMGSVKEIQIFNTILNTPDNKTVIIPNAGVSSASLINYSTEENRRVDMTFGIGYDDDIDQAKSVIMDILKKDSRVLKEPAPFIGLAELADSSVNFTVRPWAKGEDYWGVFFDTTEAVKKAFDAQGISIPYPQTDVHVHGNVTELKAAANS